MKILLITWNFPPKTGGLESVVHNIWLQLQKMNEVFVISPYMNIKNNIETHTFRTKSPQLFWFVLYSFFKGVKIVIKNKPKIIIAGSALVCPIAIILGKIFCLKIAVQIHGLDVIYSNFFYQWAIKYFLPKSNIIFANSKMSMYEAMKRGTSEKKIVVIHPGTDTQRFIMKKNREELKRKYNLEGKKVLLTVGRLAKRKGIAEFIHNSLPDVIKKVPEVIYCIVGGNPVDSLVHKANVILDIEETIKDNNLQDYVVLFGRVELNTLIEIYNLSDLFLLPVLPANDDVEGFGIVFIEANAAGIPCVATKIGGIPDAIEDSKSGILVEPNDYKTLTEKIIFLLKNPELSKNMGEYGRKRARRKFDWDVIGIQYENALNLLFS